MKKENRWGISWIIYIIGIMILVALSSYAMLICENNIGGWIGLGLIIIGSIIIRSKVAWKGVKFFLLWVSIIALIIIDFQLTKQVSLSGALLRELVVAKSAANANYMNEAEWSAPSGYVVEKTNLGSLPIEKLSKEESNSQRVILQLHGGAYVMPLINSYRDIAIKYSQANEDCDVVTIDYRVAPKDIYPAALEDAVAAYKWLMEQGYSNENIIITGDSAGGGLALATTLYLRDNEVPLPKAVIVMSPWANLENTSPSRTDNYDKDPCLGQGLQGIALQISNPDYVGEHDIKDPYISPVYGDYKDFPPLLVQVGTHEILYDDAIDVAKKAEAAGVKVQETTYNGMFHVFQMAWQIVPEGKKAWNEVQTFIKDVYAGQ